MRVQRHRTGIRKHRLESAPLISLATIFPSTRMLTRLLKNSSQRGATKTKSAVCRRVGQAVSPAREFFSAQRGHGAAMREHADSHGNFR